MQRDHGAPEGSIWLDPNEDMIIVRRVLPLGILGCWADTRVCSNRGATWTRWRRLPVPASWTRHA